MQIQKLYQAVKEHSGLEDTDIIEAYNYGADSGFSGFIFNADCIDFYDEYKTIIHDYITEYVSNYTEYSNWFEMVANFNRSDMLDIEDGYKILLSWFILEEVGCWLEEKED